MTQDVLARIVVVRDRDRGRAGADAQRAQPHAAQAEVVTCAIQKDQAAALTGHRSLQSDSPSGIGASVSRTGVSIGVGQSQDGQ